MSSSTDLADFICSLKLEGVLKKRLISMRGGAAKRVEKTATQKSAIKPYQKRGGSSSVYEGLRLKKRAQRESSKRRLR